MRRRAPSRIASHRRKGAVGDELPQPSDDVVGMRTAIWVDMWRTYRLPPAELARPKRNRKSDLRDSTAWAELLRLGALASAIRCHRTGRV